MKSIFLSILSLVSVFILSSCKKIDGKAIPVGFDEHIVFTREGGQHFIEGKKAGLTWWFRRLSVNDKVIPWENSQLTLYRDNNSPVTSIPMAIIKIEGPWFTLEKVSDVSIAVTLNPTLEKRKLSIDIQAGNAFETIEIDQDINPE